MSTYEYVDMLSDVSLRYNITLDSEYSFKDGLWLSSRSRHTRYVGDWI